MKKKAGNSRIFYKYFLSYIIVLLIPIMGIGISSYNYFIKVLEDKVISANVEKMIKVKNSIDIQLSTLGKINVQLLSNEKFRPLYIRNNPINVLEVQKTLRNYTFTNPFIHEIIFYVRGDHYLYSSSSSYTVSTFMNYIYQYSNWDISSFYYDINHISHPVLRTAEEVITNKYNKNSFITCMYPIPVNGGNPYATLIFLIEEKNLTNIMDYVFQSDQGNTLVLNDRGEVVTSLKDSSFTYTLEFQNIFSSMKGYGAKKINIGHSEYLISFAKSSGSGLSYITMIPTAQVLKEIYNIKSNVMFYTAAIFFIGAVIIYIFTVLNYNPLKKLSESAKKSTINIPEKASEIEAAQFAIGYLTQTSKKLSERIMSHQLAVKEFLLLNLLKGSFLSIEDFNKKGQDIGMVFSKHSFRVVHMALSLPEDSPNIGTPVLIEEIEKKFTDEIQGYGKESIEKDRITFILAADNLSDALLEVQLLYIQQHIKEKWGMQSTVGIGNEFKSMAHIGKSYIQASTALDYKLIKGENKVIFFMEIEQLSSINCYPKFKLEHLELSILQMNVEDISNTIFEIMDFIKENKTPLFLAKCLCFDIINTVIKTSQQLNIRFNMKDNQYPDVMSLTEFQTVDQLADLVREICFDMCEYIRKNKKNSSSTLLKRIIHYIEQHYNEYDFTIQGMAEYFYMSPSNLSHFFKDNTDQKISDFVKHLRIQKAKELLKTTDGSLQQIVENVGYSDVSSFIKKFKQLVGATPGEYRKICN